jgi:hypothetical protein
LCPLLLLALSRALFPGPSPHGETAGIRLATSGSGIEARRSAEGTAGSTSWRPVAFMHPAGGAGPVLGQLTVNTSVSHCPVWPAQTQRFEHLRSQPGSPTRSASRCLPHAPPLPRSHHVHLATTTTTTWPCPRNACLQPRWLKSMDRRCNQPSPHAQAYYSWRDACWPAGRCPTAQFTGYS